MGAEIAAAIVALSAIAAKLAANIVTEQEARVEAKAALASFGASADAAEAGDAKRDAELDAKLAIAALQARSDKQKTMVSGSDIIALLSGSLGLTAAAATP